jgi:hypothetical protein
LEVPDVVHPTLIAQYVVRTLGVSDEKDDGSLAVQAVLCNPDWDEPLRIASIQSNPKNSDAAEPVLRCDLDQKEL